MEERRITNAEQAGMAHGRLGWLEADPLKFFSFAAERNKEDIVAVLLKHLGALACGLVLELGSGSGQHVQRFAQALPRIQFQPTEFAGHPSPRAEKQEVARILGSIAAYCAGSANVMPPQEQDATVLAASAVVADEAVDAVVSINIIHVSPPAVLQGILAGAGAKLKPGGLLVFYGPFQRDGVITGEGNQRFQVMLQELDASFGIRDITEVKAQAAPFGLSLLEEIHIESSNNYINVFRKGQAGVGVSGSL